MTSTHSPKKRTSPGKRTKTVNRWSQHVSQTSDALDLESGVFKLRSAHAIAASLKRAADRSARRRGSPFQSAMSMLNFYVNRGGKQLSATRKHTLERAKDELRALFDRGPKRKATAGK